VEVEPSRLGTDRSYLKRDVTATLHFKAEFREISDGERKVLGKLGDSCVQPIKIINNELIKIVIFPLVKAQNCLDIIADGTLDHALVKKKILEIHDKIFGRLWMDKKKGRPPLQELYITRIRERINNIKGVKIKVDGNETVLLEKLLDVKLLVKCGEQVFRLDENIATMLEKASERLDSVAPPEKCCIHGDPYAENIILVMIQVSSDGTRKEYIPKLVDTSNATCDGTYDFDVVKILNTIVWYPLWMALRKPSEEQEYIRNKLRFRIEKKGDEFMVSYLLPKVPEVIEEVCYDIEKKAAVYANIIGDEHLKERKEIGLAMVQLCVAGKIAAEHPELAAILMCEGGIRLQKFLALTASNNEQKECGSREAN